MIDPTATFDNLNQPRPSLAIPLVHDTYGYLRDACNIMDRIPELFAAGETLRMLSEQNKIVELLRKHIDQTA
jgi:hypothetical protein